MYRAIQLFAALIISLGLNACSWWNKEAPDDSALLARVGTRSLYASQVGNLIPAGTSPTDSVSILKNYVERWTRDAAMINAAAESIGKNAAIDKLVDDYRTSLQRHQLEELLITERVDTIVSTEEITTLYESMAESYQAPHQLMRAVLIKVPLDHPKLELLDTEWKSFSGEEISAQLEAIASEVASLALLEPGRWFEAGELTVLLPVDLGLIREGSSVKAAGTYRFYLKVLETVDRGAKAPMAYMEPRLRKLILEERRSTFLEAFTAEVYQQAQQRDQVKIYVGNVQ